MSATLDDLIKFEEPYWEPIGKYVIAFGHLEKQVNWAITVLLSVHERQGGTITSQIISFRSRIRLMEKLVRLLVKSPILRIYAAWHTNELYAQNSFRNNLVHGEWGGYFYIDGGYWQKLGNYTLDSRFHKS